MDLNGPNDFFFIISVMKEFDYRIKLNMIWNLKVSNGNLHPSLKNWKALLLSEQYMNWMRFWVSAAQNTGTMSVDHWLSFRKLLLSLYVLIMIPQRILNLRHGIKIRPNKQIHIFIQRQFKPLKINKNQWKSNNKLQI